MPDIYLQIIALVLGQLTHLLLILSEISAATGKKFSLAQYRKARPYKFELSIIGAVIGFGILYSIHELTMLTAFGVALTSSDTIDRAGKIAASRMPPA